MLNALLLQKESMMNSIHIRKKKKSIINGQRVVRNLSFCGMYSANNLTDVDKLVHKMIVLKR